MQQHRGAWIQSRGLRKATRGEGEGEGEQKRTRGHAKGSRCRDRGRPEDARGALQHPRPWLRCGASATGLPRAGHVQREKERVRVREEANSLPHLRVQATWRALKEGACALCRSIVWLFCFFFLAVCRQQQKQQQQQQQRRQQQQSLLLTLLLRFLTLSLSLFQPWSPSFSRVLTAAGYAVCTLALSAFSSRAW